MADQDQIRGRSFTRQELQQIIDLRFGIPHIYDQLHMSFCAMGEITGLRPGVVSSNCKKILARWI